VGCSNSNISLQRETQIFAGSHPASQRSIKASVIEWLEDGTKNAQRIID
jgi:hypothetical protein